MSRSGRLSSLLGERASSGMVMTFSTLLVSFAQIARLKVFALSIGAAGVGVIAQVSAAQNLLLGVAPLFSGVGLISVLARRGLDAPEARQRCLAAARGMALLALVPAAVVGSILVFLAGRLDQALVPLIILGLLGVPFALLTSVELASLQQRGELRRLAGVNLVIAVASLALIAFFTVRLGVAGAALGLGFSPMIGWLVVTRASGGLSAIRFTFDFSEWRVIAHAGSGSITLTLITVASEAGIRTLALALLGAGGAGLTHILLTLALQFSYLTSSGITAYSLPRIATFVAGNDRSALIAELVILQRLGTLTAGSALLLLAAGREQFVDIFLSGEFHAVAELLPLVLLGELLRMQSWTLGQYLLPRGHRRVYVAVAPVFYGTFAGTFVTFAGLWGIAAVPIAHIAASAAGAGLVAWHAVRALGYPLAAGIPTICLVAAGLIASIWVPAGALPFALVSAAIAYRSLRQEARISGP